MSEVQIAIIDQEDTQITLAVPGVQGPAGAISSGGSANQVFYKVSGTNYDAGWTFIGNANVDAAAAIAGTKISPNFGSQTIATTGVFSHALGAQGTPSITFTGDLNTGIFSPGADQVAVATNGTEKLIVLSNGNVGIGTSGPWTRMEIRSANVANGVAANTFATPPANLFVGSSSGFALDDGGSIALGGNTNSSSVYSAYGAISGRRSSALGYIYDGYLAFSTAASDTLQERMRITSAGLVGIGITGPLNQLTVKATNNDGIALTRPTNATINHLLISTTETGGDQYRTKFDTLNNDFILNTYTSGGTGGNIRFRTGTAIDPTDKVIIDSSGRLLVGTSTAQGTSIFQAVGNSTASTDPGDVRIIRGLGVSSIGANVGAQLGVIRFGALENTVCAQIEAQSDATWSSTSDCPGRLVFSTTADGAASPTERMRITSGGYFKASNNATYYESTGTYHEFNNSLNTTSLIAYNTNASFSQQGSSGGVFSVVASRSGSSAYSLLCTFSDAANDVEHNLRGDGQAYADGSWNGGGADYAEYFEWSDSNQNAEDRRGISVVLDGDKIREAVTGEDPIGVISGNPSVVGDSAWNKWSGKYLRDEFSTYIQEDHEVEDKDGNIVIQQRRKLNPAYDPDVKYVSREERPEWDCVGLMGKLRIRKGQITGSRWIKMRDINDSVEEWLVR